MANPAYSKYLKLDKSRRSRIDQDKVRAEERLDGKYRIRTSDDTISAEDVALGYKQLLEVEDAFRTLKTRLSLRPVYHRLGDLIKAHILLCWLALLLVLVAERGTGQTWRVLRDRLERMHLVECAGDDGRVLQRTETTAQQKQIFAALNVPEPPRILGITATGVKNPVPDTSKHDQKDPIAETIIWRPVAPFFHLWTVELGWIIPPAFHRTRLS